MRLLLSISFCCIVLTAAYSQNAKPKIVGQKDLSTPQGEPITIKLTDLIVEETAAAGDDPGGDNDDNGEDENGNIPDEGDDGEEEKPDDEEDKDKDEEDKDEDKEDAESEDGDGNSGNGGNGAGNGNGGNSNGGTSSGGNNNAGGGNGGNDGGGNSNPEGGNGNNANAGDNDDKGNDDKNKGDNKDKDKGDDKDKDKDKDKEKDRGRINRTNAYPEGYALQVFEGKNYSVSGNTITPVPDFTGVLSVDVRVKNAAHTSPKYALKITVTAAASDPKNVAPVITGHVPLSVTVNDSITVLLSHLEVTDPDDRYPDDFTLKILPGNNYTVDKAVVIPAENFSGTLAVEVTVNDGENDSAPFNVKIIVLEKPNVAPEIAGQIPLSISKNQSINIVLSQLLVVDPDNSFPTDFSLKVFPGENFSLSGTTVKPDADFTGELSVKVSVHDGHHESNIYPLKITVMPGQNEQPVITGQAGLKIPEGQSLQIKLADLVVKDRDSRYPDDFSLHILPGDHYTVSNHTITPAPGFLGTLTVRLTVHDGKISSEPFGLKIEVIPNDRLEVIGQESLQVAEDSVLEIRLSDLKVHDPSNTYPQGFTLQVMKGENYEVSNNQIKPHLNFYGNLTVPITVSRNGITSAPFSMLVIVHPVNDPPELLYIESNPLVVAGGGPWPLFEDVEVVDADDQDLLFAEVGFDAETFQPGTDRLLFEPSENIHAVYDQESGTLFLVGRAAKEAYQTLLRSVKYDYEKPSDSLRLRGSLKVYLKINDGKDTSPVYSRELLLENNVSLKIPTAFTPNNDQANDTWKITPIQLGEEMNTFIRVYDKRGNMVFESGRLETEWDGYFNGTPLPADVYFYTIEMDFSYRKVRYKGIVSILR